MKSKYLAFSGADLRTNKISRGIGGLFAGATAFSLLNLMTASVLLPRVSAQDVAERKNLLLLLGFADRTVPPTHHHPKHPIRKGVLLGRRKNLQEHGLHRRPRRATHPETRGA